MTARALVVSAHLDDAVLSAGGRIRPGSTTVVTVFAGIPGPEQAVTPWDVWTGAASSAERMRQRHDEDDDAMARLGGVPAVRLPHLDYQYRGTRRVDTAPIEAALAALIDDGVGELWLPAGIGGHPDHFAARTAGLRAAEAFGHLTVHLYADFPYVVEFGWPQWTGAARPTPYLDAAAWLAGETRARGLDSLPLERRVVTLDDGAARRKRHAVEAYRSQLPALKLHPAVLDADPTLLSVELDWRLRR